MVDVDVGVRAPVVAVNARFSHRVVTGVERYASELHTRVQRALGPRCAALAPRRPVGAAAGHLWEQTVLPLAFRRSPGEVLLSLCNVGPVTVPSQLVVIHDVAPFMHPQSFTPQYRTQVRGLQRLLVRRCSIATVSERSRCDIAEVFSLAPEHIAVVPPAVGAPFEFAQATGGGRHCVFVGGHDARKNLGFLLSFWNEVHRRTGLELHVVGRSPRGTLRAGSAGTVAGVVWHRDIDDAALAALYRSALCVVSPSRYEGFGLPLLEGMACGTPFLATDTGAAAELAVAPDRQLLPLDADAWIQRLATWADGGAGDLRDRSLVHARRWSWDRSANALLTAAGVVRGR